jgi:hypothetical protein
MSAQPRPTSVEAVVFVIVEPRHDGDEDQDGGDGFQTHGLLIRGFAARL